MVTIIIFKMRGSPTRTITQRQNSQPKIVVVVSTVPCRPIQASEASRWRT